MYDATMTACIEDKTSPLLIQNKPIRVCKGCRNWRTVNGNLVQVEPEWLSIHGLCRRCQNRPRMRLDTTTANQWTCAYAY